MVDSKLFWQTGPTTEKSCVCMITIFPINIPDHPYVLMNQCILCNCNIEAESKFLLESLAACEGPGNQNRPRNAFHNKFSLCELNLMI